MANEKRQAQAQKRRPSCKSVGQADDGNSSSSSRHSHATSVSVTSRTSRMSRAQELLQPDSPETPPATVIREFSSASGWSEDGHPLPRHEKQPAGRESATSGGSAEDGHLNLMTSNASSPSQDLNDIPSSP